MKSATPCSKPCQSNGNLDSNATEAYSPTMTTPNIRIIARNVNRYENAIRIDPTIRENAKMTALGIMAPAQPESIMSPKAKKTLHAITSTVHIAQVTSRNRNRPATCDVRAMGIIPFMAR